LLYAQACGGLVNTVEYERMYKLEMFYWWFVARRKLLAEFMRVNLAPREDRLSIIDIGCGTGLNHSVLAEFGDVDSMDVSPVALEFSRKRGISRLQSGSVEQITFPDNTFDVLTALDVLEHADDDLAAMGEMWRVAKPNATVLITVPAYGFLWSEHDEALHHRRRYTAGELRNKLTNCGFQIERCSYFITLLFFPILLVRILQNLRKHSLRAQTSHIILPRWLNSVLIGILDLERILLRYINLPFGVSLVCVARKPAHNSFDRPGYLPVVAANSQEESDNAYVPHAGLPN
jgi:SAM-dependent methyltransferase